MSLVERAAKRLGELGKAAQPGAGSAAPDDAAASLIERAVGKIDPRDPKRPAPRQMPAPTQARPVATSVTEQLVDHEGPERREPRLDDAAERVPAAPGGPRRSSSAPHKGQRIELDIPKLAAAGVLDPEDPESAMANEFRKIKRPLIQACQGRLAAPVVNANRV